MSCCAASVLAAAISCRPERGRDITFDLVKVDVAVVVLDGRDMRAVGGSSFLVDFFL